MKCIYCEENEAKDVLLCYSCQVDLFPLVSAWVYCGACGNELSAEKTVCPQCAQTEAAPAPVVESAEFVGASASSQQLMLSAQKPSPTNTLLREPHATREEIKKARRFQWIIRTVLALFWMSVLVMILLWARDFVNQPVDNIYQ